MVTVGRVWTASVSSGQEEVPSDVAINNDGSRLIVCRGRKIVLYDCSNGSIIKELKGHKDKVYSVSFSSDGKAIASGGADKSTIIWSEEGKGILKFTHSDSVQVVSFHPVENLLASCSSSDFGFWSQTEKSVVKHKVESKILCATWRHDGLVLTLGLLSGKVAFYNVQGVQIGCIIRSAPVWSLCWSNSMSIENVVLIGSWDRTLSFYNEFGDHLNEDIYLDYYPTSVISFGHSSEYIAVGGSLGNLKLLNGKGVLVDNISSSKDRWIWSIAALTKQDVFATIDSSGILSFYRYDEREIKFDHWRNKIAVCENCSDVVIHDVDKEKNRKLECGDLVKALSLIDNQIAVVIRNEVWLYECSAKKYDFRCKIVLQEPISCVMMMTNIIFVSMGRSIKAYQKHGKFINEWEIDSDISSVQRLCNVFHEEKILIGCWNGKLHTLSINSPFHATILNLEEVITSIEVSCKGRYIGIIYDKSNLCIFDQVAKVQVQNIIGPEFMLFHNKIDYLVCHGINDGNVTIQDLNGCSVINQCKGQVISFLDSKIVGLQKDLSIEFHHINLVTFAYQKISKSNDFDSAFEIADIGSPDNFLRWLGKVSLINQKFEVSIKCYRKLSDRDMIDYVRTQQLNTPQDSITPKQIKAIIATEIAMIENDVLEACCVLKNENVDPVLVDIFVRMRKFQHVKDLLKDGDERRLYIIAKEAEWEEQMKNYEMAANLYIESKNYLKAVDVIGQSKIDGWVELICNFSTQIPSDEVDALKKCTFFLSGKSEVDTIVIDILIKIQDYSSLMGLYMKNHQWIEAGKLCSTKADEVNDSHKMIYADWLAHQGNWKEAVDIYGQIRRQDKTIKLKLSLIEKEIFEENFKEASWLYNSMSTEADLIIDSKHREMLLVKESELFACLYYAYAIVSDAFSTNLVTINQPSTETIFNVCTYIVNSIDVSKVPRGISIVRVLYYFAKCARVLEAFQTAKIVLHRAQEEYIIPQDLQNEFRLQTMAIKSEPYEDHKDFVPICYRCGSANTTIEKKAKSIKLCSRDSCRSCFHPNIRCFINFDILPLIEFQPNNGISHKEALTLIRKDAKTESTNSNAFNRSINSTLRDTETRGYVPVKVDHTTLESLNRDEIYIIGAVASNDLRFFKNIIPEIGIAVCKSCNNFFHEEDFEYEFLKQDGCPFCRSKVAENYGHV